MSILSALRERFGARTKLARAKAPRGGERKPGKRRRAVVHAYRVARLRNWSWRARQSANARRMERYGLDVSGPAKEVADARRVLRNARKIERWA